MGRGASSPVVVHLSIHQCFSSFTRKGWRTQKWGVLLHDQLPQFSQPLVERETVHQGRLPLNSALSSHHLALIQQWMCAQPIANSSLWAQPSRTPRPWVTTPPSTWRRATTQTAPTSRSPPMSSSGKYTPRRYQLFLTGSARTQHHRERARLCRRQWLLAQRFRSDKLADDTRKRQPRAFWGRRYASIIHHYI